MSVQHSAKLRSIFYLRLLHCSDCTVNGRSPKYDLASFKEITILWYHQSHLVLIVTWYVWYLYPQDHVSQGLGNFLPQSAQRNVSVMVIKVLDRAYLQASVLHELRCYQVTRAPLSIRQVVFTPSIIAVPKSERSNHRFWGLHSKMQRELIVACQFWPGPNQPWPYPSGGPGSLGPAPPSQFNDCLFRFSHSLARFNESLSGSVHSAQR